MKTSLWVSPICEQLSQIFIALYINYEKGEEAATRTALNMQGMKIEPVTKRALKVAFTQHQINHLCRVMDAFSPHPELAADFHLVRDQLKLGQLLTGNRRMITMVNYQADFTDVLVALHRAKTGQTKTFEEIAREQKEAGKDLFEV